MTAPALISTLVLTLIMMSAYITLAGVALHHRGLRIDRLWSKVYSLRDEVGRLVRNYQDLSDKYDGLMREKEGIPVVEHPVGVAGLKPVERRAVTSKQVSCRSRVAPARHVAGHGEDMERVAHDLVHNLAHTLIYAERVLRWRTVAVDRTPDMMAVEATLLVGEGFGNDPAEALYPLHQGRTEHYEAKRNKLGGDPYE